MVFPVEPKPGGQLAGLAGRRQAHTDFFYGTCKTHKPSWRLPWHRLLPAQPLPALNEHGPGLGQRRSPTGFSQRASSIYLIKRDRYKNSSSSKRGRLLWIRSIFSTASMVYPCFDVAHKRCIALAPKVYRFLGVGANRASAHSLLWICMGLSTPCAGRKDALACRLLGRQERRGQNRCCGRQVRPEEFDAWRPQFGDGRKKKIFPLSRHCTGLQPI